MVVEHQQTMHIVGLRQEVGILHVSFTLELSYEFEGIFIIAIEVIYLAEVGEIEKYESRVIGI